MSDSTREPVRVTLATLASELGVSRATVSNAYNRPDQLSATLRTKILRRARELGFAGPDPLGRSLRRGRVGTVGLLLDEPLSYAFSDPAARALLDGLAHSLQEDGLALTLFASQPTGLDATPVRAAAVDGWVVHSLPLDHPFVTAARERGQPLVVLDQPTLPGVPLVGIDDLAGAQLATEHLLGLGHRRLAVLAFKLRGDAHRGVVSPGRLEAITYEVTRRRYQGVVAGLAAYGRDPDELTVVETPHNDVDSAATVAAELLGRDDRPSAVVCFSDQLALGVLAAARAANLLVPRDLSVTGFDDTAAAALADPPLTTVSQALRDRGAQVGGLLRALLRGEQVSSPALGAVAITVRASTAPPP